MSKTNTNMNIFGLIKKANTNTNMNIRTDIRKYKYEYKYLSNTDQQPTALPGAICSTSSQLFYHQPIIILAANYSTIIQLVY